MYWRQMRQSSEKQRSILNEEKQEAPNPFECEVIEDSIITYDKSVARRNRQPEHDGDYAVLDLALHQAALEEIGQLDSSHAI